LGARRVGRVPATVISMVVPRLLFRYFLLAA
jgi:hypothetical protein